MIDKRVFSSLISIILGISMLSGCAQSTHSPSGKPVITVWHWMTDRDPVFQELARQYEQKTGVKVRFELYAPSDAYSQKVRVSALAQSLPDVFGILGEKRDFVSFINAGHVLNLAPAMEENAGEWKNKFFSKALAVNELESDNSYGVLPGIYGAPLDVMTIQMLYNKDLLKDLGFDPDKPPQTLAEMLEVGKKAREKGLQGLVSGWGELWMIDCLANNYAFNIMGKDKFIATLKGEVPYTDPDWVKVLTVFKDMQRSGLLVQGIVTMINKTAEQLFANGKAVFAFNGSWCVNVYKGMNPDLRYGAMLPPRAGDAYPMAIWGGAGSSFLVNARSKNKDEAVKFLKWLTDDDQQAYLAQATMNLPANRNSLRKVPEVLAQFSDTIDVATHPNVWGVSEYPAVIDAFDKGIQQIVLGERSPEQVAQEVQKVKEREKARKR
jgi:raffinose/stachyose/melibiose transport system substrate-binding protein